MIVDAAGALVSGALAVVACWRIRAGRAGSDGVLVWAFLLLVDCWFSGWFLRGVMSP